MKLKAAFALALVVFSARAKADVVVLQNITTENQSTVVSDTVEGGGTTLDTNIYFSTSASSSSLSRLILFGTANQTGISATFNVGSGFSNAITATEISANTYAFDLVGVLGFSNILSGVRILQMRAFSTGSAFYTTTDTTMTSLNGAGFVGQGYNGNNLRFQFEGNSTAIPEPSTLILTASALAAGAVGAWVKRRRKKNAEGTI